MLHSSATHVAAAAPLSPCCALAPSGIHGTARRALRHCLCYLYCRSNLPQRSAGLLQEASDQANIVTSADRGPYVRGFLDHVFNVQPLAPEVSSEDDPGSGNTDTTSVSASIISSPQPAQRHVVLVRTHPFGIRAGPSSVNRYSLESLEGAVDLQGQRHQPHDDSHTVDALIVAPLSFHHRFATLLSADHVRAADAANVSSGDHAMANTNAVFSQPRASHHTGDHINLLSSNSSLGQSERVSAARITDSSVQQMARHCVDHESDDMVKILERGLRQLHWPKLPAWFPILDHTEVAFSAGGEHSARATTTTTTRTEAGVAQCRPGVVLLHGHKIPEHHALAALHSSYDVFVDSGCHGSDDAAQALAQATATEERKDARQQRHNRPHMMRKGRRGSMIAHVARRKRHMVALQLLQVGSPAETAFLLLVVLFGVVALLMTTIQSALQAAGVVANEQPAVCVA